MSLSSLLYMIVHSARFDISFCYVCMQYLSVAFFANMQFSHYLCNFDYICIWFGVAFFLFPIKEIFIWQFSFFICFGFFKFLLAIFWLYFLSVQILCDFEIPNHMGEPLTNHTNFCLTQICVIWKPQNTRVRHIQPKKSTKSTIDTGTEKTAACRLREW